jgi:hypothetical protein
MEPKKQATFPVWDQETDEIIEMIMDEDDYQAMVEYEEQMEFERKERRERLRKEEHAAFRLDRDS